MTLTELYNVFLLETGAPFDVWAANSQLDGRGVCLKCGDTDYPYCEPDARGYHCGECHSDSVMGWYEVLLTYGDRLAALADKHNGEPVPTIGILRQRAAENAAKQRGE